MKVGSKELRRRGCLFIVSGPSGAGKTSISRPALGMLDGITLSVSYTTRRPRAGETDGVDYRFIPEDRFNAMIQDGEFAEWAEVHGFLYGTSKKDVDAALSSGRDLLLDIDVQGAGQLRQHFAAESVSVFLLPPSKEELSRRLAARGTDSNDTVRERLANACREIAGLTDYDYVLFNDDLSNAVDQFVSIVRSERATVSRLNREDLSHLLQSFDEPS